MWSAVLVSSFGRIKLGLADSVNLLAIIFWKIHGHLFQSCLFCYLKKEKEKKTYLVTCFLQIIWYNFPRLTRSAVTINPLYTMKKKKMRGQLVWYMWLLFGLIVNIFSLASSAALCGLHVYHLLITVYRFTDYLNFIITFTPEVNNWINIQTPWQFIN